MTAARFRKLLLALEGVTERPHMDRAAFRTKRKIHARGGDRASATSPSKPPR